MRIAILAGAALAVFIAGAPAHAVECDQSPLVIDNVRLLDADGRQSIAIAGGRIAWIGESGAEPAAFADVRRLDGDGATALPGLIDSHVHFDALPAAKDRQRTLNVESEIYPITLRQTLASGVTTARVHLSALDDMALLKTIADDPCFPAPRIILSGPGLRGGAPTLDARLMRGVANASDLSAKIDDLAERGADWIALHAPSAFNEEERLVLREASQKNDIKFMIDGDNFADFSAALDLNATSIEYLNRTDASGYPDEILTAISARDTPLFISAPIGYYGRSAAYSEADEKVLDQQLFDFVPEALETEMRETFSDAFAQDQYIERAITAFPTMATKFQQLRSAGAQMVVGSDSGSLGQFHHDAIWTEMSAWRSFGVSSADTIAGATSAPAKMLERNDIGSLDVGARSDIVLFASDLEDIGFDRESVNAVIKGGVIFVADGEWRGPDAASMAAHIEALNEQ